MALEFPIELEFRNVVVPVPNKLKFKIVFLSRSFRVVRPRLLNKRRRELRGRGPGTGDICLLVPRGSLHVVRD